MRVAFGERVRRGRAVDLRNEGVPASAVVAAITDPDDGRVRGQRPAAVHEHVGVLCEGTTLRVGVALAAAARSRGARTAHDDELAAVTRQLAGLSTPDVDLAAARERVAAAEVAVGHMRERAARVQGRTQPGDGEPVVAVTRALTAVETEWHAAKERLRRAQAAWGTPAAGSPSKTGGRTWSRPPGTRWWRAGVTGFGGQWTRWRCRRASRRHSPHGGSAGRRGLARPRSPGWPRRAHPWL